jgi:undecaprenyl-diphosphatase
MTARSGTSTGPQVRRAGRLTRGALAMVLFAVPVLLLGYAARQKFDPLIRFDDAVIRWSTGVTRSAGAAGLLITLQEVSRPFVLYILASAVGLWAWFARGLRNRARLSYQNIWVERTISRLYYHH